MSDKLHAIAFSALTLFYGAVIGLRPVLAIGEGTMEGSDSIELTNPIAATSIVGLIKSVGVYVLELAAVILTVVILVGAFQWLASGGKPEAITRGRKTITWGIIGFAVILIAGGIGTIIANLLGAESPEEILNAPVRDFPGVIGVINTVARWMFGILMALGTVFVVYSGILYVISQGNDQRISTARRTLTWAIVALVVGVLAGGISLLVQNAFSNAALESQAPQLPTEEERCFTECLQEGNYDPQECRDRCQKQADGL